MVMRQVRDILRRRRCTKGDVYVYKNRNKMPFIDVAYSLHPVYFSAKTDEGSAHVKVRKTAICQCVVELYYEWNDNYCKQSMTD